MHFLSSEVLFEEFRQLRQLAAVETAKGEGSGAPLHAAGEAEARQRHRAETRRLWPT